MLVFPSSAVVGQVTGEEDQLRCGTQAIQPLNGGAHITRRDPPNRRQCPGRRHVQVRRLGDDARGRALHGLPDSPPRRLGNVMISLNTPSRPPARPATTVVSVATTTVRYGSVTSGHPLPVKYTARKIVAPWNRGRAVFAKGQPKFIAHTSMPRHTKQEHTQREHEVPVRVGQEGLGRQPHEQQGTVRSRSRHRRSSGRSSSRPVETRQGRSTGPTR